MKLKDFFRLLKMTAIEWSADKAPRLAAALAYYTVFSLAPFLTLIITVSGMVVGQSGARGQILAQLQGLVGPDAMPAVTAMIDNANRPDQGVMTSVISAVVLVVAATGLFSQLHDALNTVWEIRPKPMGVLGMIRERFFSFTLVLGVAFMLLVSLVVSAILSSLNKFTTGLFPGQEQFWQTVNFLVSFAVVTLLFALIFKYLPEVRIKWRDVWLGAAVTSLLFTLGKLGIGLYLGNSGVASAYGAASSLVIILLWVYYSAMILFFGAEFTQVYSRQFGSGYEPAHGATFLTVAARLDQGMEAKNQAALPTPAIPSTGGNKANSPAQRGLVALGALVMVLVGFLGGSFIRRK